MLGKSDGRECIFIFVFGFCDNYFFVLIKHDSSMTYTWTMPAIYTIWFLQAHQCRIAQILNCLYAHLSSAELAFQTCVQSLKLAYTSLSSNYYSVLGVLRSKCLEYHVQRLLGLMLQSPPFISGARIRSESRRPRLWRYCILFLLDV